MANIIPTKEQRAELAPEATYNIFYTPRVDILETDEELTLFADLPGVSAEGVEVRFENGELILHGCCSPRQKDVDFLTNEYGVGDFYRTFSVAQDVDAEKISAELKKGVLVVHLPKSEAAKPKRITVKGE